MARPQTRSEILAAASLNFARLKDCVSSLDEDEQRATFPHSVRLTGREAHWARDLNLRDVLVHLYEWHQLLLRWVDANQAGHEQPFLPSPYNWRNYGALNETFWRQHQQTSYEEAWHLLDESHRQVLALIYSFSDDELSIKAYFPWTGTTSLGSYCVSATSSHYEWALKKIKAYSKALGKK